VLFSGPDGGGSRGIIGAGRAAVCLSDGARLAYQEEDPMDTVCTVDGREGGLRSVESCPQRQPTIRSTFIDCRSSSAYRLTRSYWSSDRRSVIVVAIVE
jgi:hypothetical protein